MAPEERKDKIRWAEDEVWNKGNVDALDEVIAPQFSSHDPSFPFQGLAGMKQRARELLTAHPDLHMEVHEVLCDGDLTAYRWTQSGTAREEFRGVPATGKSYVISGMNIDRWEGDRIVEGWIVYDMLGALQQLGVIPDTLIPKLAS